MPALLVWLGVAGITHPRETHVAESWDESSVTMFCGAVQVVTEDKLKPFEFPYYGWWFQDCASCAECKRESSVVHDKADVERAREILQRPE